MRPQLATIRGHLLRKTQRIRPSIPRDVTCSRAASSSSGGSIADVVHWPFTTILDALHATGLPWWIVIPSTAVLARASLVHFLTAKIRRRRYELQPVLEPMIHARVRATIHERMAASDAHSKAVGQRYNVTTIWRAHRMIQKQVRKAFRIKSAFWQNTGNFAILLGFSDAIRRKCTDREGLLSFLLRPVTWLKDTIMPSPKSASVDALVEPTASSAADAVAESPSFDPTLLVEGIPNWCENLTMTDQTLMLPLLLGASFAYPTLVKWYRGGTRNFMDRGSLSLALLYVPIAGSMPSALLLYLVSSSLTTHLYGIWFNWNRPRCTPITACKQPLYARSRKEWSDAPV